MRKPFLLLLVLVVVAFDQFSKYVALLKLSDGWVQQVLPCLNFTLAFNKGVAFSIFYRAGSDAPWFLIVMTATLSLVILGMLLRTPKTQGHQQVALALIFSGAVSNLFDRIYHGAVVDFIDVHAFGWHWPAFNVADSAISIGAVLLIIDSLRQPALAVSTTTTTTTDR